MIYAYYTGWCHSVVVIVYSGPIVYYYYYRGWVYISVDNCLVSLEQLCISS